MYSSQKEDLPKFLRGNYTIEWKEEEYEIRINDVKVYPETFLMYPANNVNNKYKNKKLIIVDIGGNTTNICKIESGKFNENDCITKKYGMYHIDQDIAQHLDSTYVDFNLSCDETDVEYFRKEGLYLGTDTTVNYMDVEEENIKDIYRNLLDNIPIWCQEKGWNITGYEVLIGGGGGKLMYDIIKNEYFPRAELCKDPIFDNYEGLEMIAKVGAKNAS
jgi:hypothetical protein